MKKDTNMISELRKNGRIQLTELSRRNGLPISTIHERLKGYIAQGLVKPSVLLDFVKLRF